MLFLSDINLEVGAESRGKFTVGDSGGAIKKDFPFIAKRGEVWLCCHERLGWTSPKALVAKKQNGNPV